MSRVPYALIMVNLMYVMICTILDIAQAVGFASISMENSGGRHLSVIKKIHRYIKGTLGVALCFKRLELVYKGYVSYDFTGDLDNMGSTIGYVFTRKLLGFKD